MAEVQENELQTLRKSNAELWKHSAIERIQWAVGQYGAQATLLASMQKTSSVLLHMFHELKLDNEILFVDTGFHFHETLKLRDELLSRYRLNIVTLYPTMTPAEQEQYYELKLYDYQDGQPQCCLNRKEKPFLDHVRHHDKKLVMLGLTRAEGGARAAIEPLSPDPRFNGLVLHPLLDWSEPRVDEYLQTHDVPVHPLHAKGYPSIGCQVCTTPVQPGEDPRAGRWRHLREDADGPQYCGINFSDGGGI